MIDGHILLFCHAAWGHTRPICTFASRLVKLQPFHVTLITSPSLVDKVHLEISRSFDAHEHARHDLIRVVSLSFEAVPFALEAVEVPFREIYERLLNKEPISCAVKGTSFPPVPPPTCAILDFFAVHPFRTIRSLSPQTKILAWQSGSSSYLFREYGPAEQGGHMASLAGKRFEETLAGLFTNITGELVTLPGLPPMYDHEFFPQPSPPGFEAPLTLMHLAGFEVINNCDGIVQTTDASYDTPGIRAIDAWMSSLSPPRPLYNIGPQLPHSHPSEARSGELEQTRGAGDVLAFLDKTLASHGAESLVYIAFGSIFGPWMQPDRLWTILDVLMEHNVPFILSHAAPFAVIPDDVAAKVKEFDLGFLSSWTPQQTILNHPVTGWFITHCGQNSASESLAAGVPLIAWDFAADQPVTALGLTVLGVAYQLFEVRAPPHGLKPIHRLGTDKHLTGTVDAVRTEITELLTKMKGDDGAEKRRNARRVRAELEASMAEGGRARGEMHRLIADLAA
ncbi:UDP-Glycosyltransferase/glycogen phosphorylase [Punctularia strigosozonata HHB-11173 SS5]|uniref:UDP-Glycosyltransferase/glycogen phosphorylase n=1 Tax=Punctularia strigosozonata (strain HHB-11173) TaxID=741275 RepID=UPI000441634C|nr:UDP-Glycosyltransferase/glycogen phosphorylase [Punctularia strigosozonata HHB-11173 SS5]EIN06307.1 UDP-Glycosyltransferase/glycogen phosphorylase [Punctularia strigosozonata HHB-11173 SS5]